MEFGKLVKKYREKKGWSQTFAARYVGLSQPSLSAIEKGRRGKMPTKKPEKFLELVESLDIPVSEIEEPYLAKAFNPMQISNLESVPQHFVDRRPLHSHSYDLPVYYCVGAINSTNEQGAVVVSAEPVELIERPNIVASVAQSYGVRVCDSTMDPAYRAGDVIFMHPHMPPVPDAFVLLRSEANGAREGKRLAMIALLLGDTPTHWNVKRYNPPSDLILLKSEWPIADRIVGQNRR